MGMIGRRTKVAVSVAEPSKPKKKRDNTQHRNLCISAAKWLRRSKLRDPSCPYVVVELVTAGQESPDVFGWNYWTTVLIEVKVSRSDFLADAKNHFRKQPEDGVGSLRYYCCPSGLIQEDEVPESWGLIWEDENGIVTIKKATHQQTNAQAEVAILSSIMRREGVRAKLFDYRNK